MLHAIIHANFSWGVMPCQTTGSLFSRPHNYVSVCTVKRHAGCIKFNFNKNVFHMHHFTKSPFLSFHFNTWCTLDFIALSLLSASVCVRRFFVFNCVLTRACKIFCQYLTEKLHDIVDSATRSPPALVKNFALELIKSKNTLSGRSVPWFECKQSLSKTITMNDD